MSRKLRMSPKFIPSCLGADELLCCVCVSFSCIPKWFVYSIATYRERHWITHQLLPVDMCFLSVCLYDEITTLVVQGFKQRCHNYRHNRRRFLCEVFICKQIKNNCTRATTWSDSTSIVNEANKHWKWNCAELLSVKFIQRDDKYQVIFCRNYIYIWLGTSINAMQTSSMEKCSRSNWESQIAVYLVPFGFPIGSKTIFRGTSLHGIYVLIHSYDTRL